MYFYMGNDKLERRTFLYRAVEHFQFLVVVWSWVRVLHMEEVSLQGRIEKVTLCTSDGQYVTHMSLKVILQYCIV